MMPGMETPEGCPDCVSGLYRDGRCIVCAIHRMREQHRQMRERSGPLYEQAAEGSRAASDAWRTAGSPPRVVAVRVGCTGADGEYVSERRWFLAAKFKRGERAEATPEQVAAWNAWRYGPR
jgi:hypothetical protein